MKNVLKTKIKRETKINYSYKNKFNFFEDKLLIDAISSANNSISFKNSKFLNIENKLEIANSVEQLLLAYSIRSEVYNSLGYSQSFKNVAKGLDFDFYDKNSIVFLHKYNKESIIGTSRIIFDDLKYGLQTDKYFNLDSYRKKYNLAEVSRMVILPNFKGLTNTVFDLVRDTYLITKSNNISHIICSVTPNHSKKYLCLGGVEIIAKNIDANLPTSLNVILWDLNKAKPQLLRRWNL